MKYIQPSEEPSEPDLGLYISGVIKIHGRVETCLNLYLKRTLNVFNSLYKFTYNTWLKWSARMW